MKRIIKTCSAQYQAAALDLIETVFTEHENAAEGRLVRQLAEEIRAKEYYIPELELIMTDEADEIVGCAVNSKRRPIMASVRVRMCTCPTSTA